MQWRMYYLVAFLGLLALGPLARAHVDTAVTEAAKFDVLVYKDGDRLNGHLKERTETEFVFLSERFGLLRVPVADAKVVLANGEDSAVAEARARTEAATGPFTMSSLLSRQELAAALQSFFGQWHGRLVISAEVVSDTTERTTQMIEAHLQRKWPEDNVQLNARYDFSETDHVTTSDIFKTDASWRHDLPYQLFSIYNPSLEWNRAFAVDLVPADYVLLQQEIGAGINLLSSAQRNLRVGLSENLFDRWQIVAPDSHTSKTAESAFLEADMKLPWQMKLTERGVWYYSLNTGRDGWENKLELDKKLSETFTIGLRHELRYNNPGVQLQDYTLLKLLMGIDF